MSEVLDPTATDSTSSTETLAERRGSQEISAEINDEISAEISADVGTVKAATAKDGQASDDDGKKDDQDAIDALAELPTKLFARVCRRIPLRTFLAELERLDRSVFYRYFKGYRPGKIDAVHLEKVLRREIFENKNGLLAQLVIYNWDEAEYRLYGALQREVKKINEDVEAIEAITDAEADPIMTALEAEFDKRDVYIATVINGVRVSKDYKKQRFGSL